MQKLRDSLLAEELDKERAAAKAKMQELRDFTSEEQDKKREANRDQMKKLRSSFSRARQGEGYCQGRDAEIERCFHFRRARQEQGSQQGLDEEI